LRITAPISQAITDPLRFTKDTALRFTPQSFRFHRKPRALGNEFGILTGRRRHAYSISFFMSADRVAAQVRMAD
jgi:hypothetical protein